MLLPIEFYRRPDVLQISRELLGKVLYTKIEGKVTAGIITETEAYMAPEDKASHAYGGKRTPRTAPFYKAGGISYVYLCYGIHHLFNIITNEIEIPHAILIRSIEPVEGIPHILKRRNLKNITPKISSGPGSLSKSLGISMQHNEISLLSKTIWLKDCSINIPPKEIAEVPRIGINYAEEYVLKPWRFYWKKSQFISGQK